MLSQPGDHRERNRSRHRKKVTEPGALTNLIPQRKGQVNTPKEGKQDRGTHKLETI